jgi:Domain of unknown function (DUF4340)
MRSTVLLLCLLGLMAGTYFFFVSGGNTSFDERETEFAIKDTAAVYKVVLEKITKGEKKATLTLERKKTYWSVDGRYTALYSKVSNFLQTLASIHVKDAMKGKTQESALKVLKENHTVVTIYDSKGGVIKKYYVGATNNQQTANILLLDNADNAYMVSRPGMDGYVSIQYTVNPMNWREKLVFNLLGSDLSSIRAEYETPSRSFHLSKSAPDQAWILADKDGKPVADFKAVRGEEYAKLFNGSVYAADFAEVGEDGVNTLYDSISVSSPIANFTFTTFNGSQTQMRLFRKDDRGQNYFGLIDDQKAVYIVQPFVIDKYLMPIEFFRR